MFRSGVSDATVLRPQKIGLLNHMGGGNLGDDATQTAVMNNIRTRWPNAVIFGFSMNPSDSRTRHGILSYPIRRQTWEPSSQIPNSRAPFREGVKRSLTKHPFVFRLARTVNRLATRWPSNLLREVVFLVSSCSRLRPLDLLIISGGGQLLDSWGGPWAFPYTIFKWVLLARLLHIKCYFLDVGAGPLEQPLSRWFTKHALVLADYTSFRDGKSRNLAQDIGFKAVSQVCPDIVYSLDIPASNNRSRPTLRSVVGIAPMAYCDPRHYWQKDQIIYDRLIRQFAVFGSSLVRQGHHLTLFSTDIWFDADTLEDTRIALDDAQVESNCITHGAITTVAELLALMSSMEYVVTCRFHGVVFAHLMNIPVIAVSHHPKVVTLMNDLELSKYCVDIRWFDSDLLAETFSLVVNNRDEIKSRMADKLLRYKTLLTDQFAGLFPLESAK